MNTKKVLVVDDSLIVKEILTYLLTDLGCEVITAQDGIEAIEKVYQESPDLILLDVMMPHMNGYQVCRLLKDDKDTRHIPVVFLTAQDQPADRYWGFMAGADEYLIKDLEHENLVERIESILKQVDTTEERALRKKPRQVTSVDILSQVNNLLDRKLYQSTIVNEINQLAVSMQNFEETLKSVFQLLSRIIQFQIGVVSIIGPDLQKIYLYAQDTLHPSLLNQISTLFQEDSKSKQTFLELKGRITETSSLRTLASYCKVPLISKGGQIGSILLGDSKTGKLLEEDQNILKIAAKEAAVVIDNARLYDYNAQLYMDLEKEIQQISSIQRSLLPHTNPLEQWVEIQSIMIPAREVGGDYYDYFLLNDHKLAITIGDVTGKGAPASLLMAMVKTALQVKVNITSELPELLSFLNAFVRDQRAGQYMTLFFGILDLSQRVFTYVNAGHNFPYLVSPSTQKLQFLESSFLPLGLEKSGKYRVSKQKINPEDFLFFYTDGIVEAMDENRELFGYERLEEILLKNCRLSLEEIKQRVLEGVQAFCGTAPVGDDRTLVLLRCK
jgi:sigma-B regulation protein RsbU (phosphoserine phosphatase)